MKLQNSAVMLASGVLCLGAATLGVAGTSSASSPPQPVAAVNSAVSTFDYRDYPKSTGVSPTCSAANLTTDLVTVGTWKGSSLEAAPRLHAGDRVTWTFHATSAGCSGDVASLAIYAASNSTFNGAIDQTSAGSASGTVQAPGSTVTISLTVPPHFAGPYQLDAVAGAFLPIVGPHGSFYGGGVRPVQSDGRNMLAGSTNGTVGKLGTWVDTTTRPFDYGNYPAGQFATGSTPCDSGSGIAYGGDSSTRQGFTVTNTRGISTWYGTDTHFVLHRGDVVKFVYRTTSEACDGQVTTIALYRNPDGGNGLMDTRVNQRLVTSTTTRSSVGHVSTLTLRVPKNWECGYQLDVVLGAALPIIGDAGRTYHSGGTFITSNYNMIG